MNASVSLEFPQTDAVITMDPARRANLSVREAAQILGLSPQRVGFYIRRGDLPASIHPNGLDYLLARKDVMTFLKERQRGKRQTAPGRPGPTQLARLRPIREEAALNRERLRQLKHPDDDSDEDESEER